MTIEIRQPELEALIHQRMKSGQFTTAEDALLDALGLSPAPLSEAPQHTPKKSFTQFMMESPLWGSELEIERNTDLPRIPEL